jgi:YggT family protein
MMGVNNNLWFEMVFFLAKTIHWVFQVYIILIMVRIIGSWFPSFAHHKLMRFVAFYTDPYLNLFRRLIPPIGGRLDLSPMLAFFGLQMMQGLVTYILTLFTRF